MHIMKLKFLTIILTVIVVLLTPLSLWSVSSMDHSSSSHKCPISTLSEQDCPPATNALSLVQHHASGLVLLDQALIGTNALLLLLSVLFLGVLLSIFVHIRNFLLPTIQVQRYYKQSQLVFARSRMKLLDWLSLHTKRDPHAHHIWCMSMAYR